MAMTDNKQLIERLRRLANKTSGIAGADIGSIHEAADTIERLEAERDGRLKVPDGHDPEDVEKLAQTYAEWSSDKPWDERHPRNQEHWRKVAKIVLTLWEDQFIKITLPGERERDAAVLEGLLTAISRHQNQIKMREEGRRISPVVADNELWSALQHAQEQVEK